MLISRRHGAKPGTFFIALACIAAFCWLMLSADHSSASPQPATGIEGSFSVGPITGGPSRQDAPDSAPLANMAFVVENGTGTVVTFTTDEKGRFRVPLPPGKYIVRTADMKTKNAKCRFEVEVNTTGFKKVNYECDSGMR